MDVQLSLHLLVFEVDIVIHLEDTDKRETLPNKLRHLAQREVGSLVDQSLDLFLHHLLRKWDLELNSLEHALEVGNIWQLLVESLHFVVGRLDLREGHLRNVEVQVLTYLVVDLLEVGFSLFLLQCLGNHLELFESLLDLVELCRHLVLSHDELGGGRDECLRENVAHGAEDHIKDEGKDGQEGANIHDVLLEGEQFNLLDAFSEIKGQGQLDLL